MAFVKGQIPWNKGLQGIHNPHTKEWNEKISLALMGKKNNLGKKLSEESRKKISEAHTGMKKPWTTKRNLENNPAMIGENHYLWKGDKVGYEALHHWVKRHMKKPAECVYCGEDEKRIVNEAYQKGYHDKEMSRRPTWNYFESKYKSFFTNFKVG
jgi:hypothetical protein